MNEDYRELVEEFEEHVHKSQKLLAKMKQRMGMRGGYPRNMGQAGGVYWGNQGMNDYPNGYDPRFM